MHRSLSKLNSGKFDNQKNVKSKGISKFEVRRFIVIFGVDMV